MGGGGRVGGGSGRPTAALGRKKDSRVSQHPADHVRVLDVPLVVADGAPFTQVVHLKSYEYEYEYE